MKALFVHYQSAHALSDAGFDEPCMAYYSSNGDLLPLRGNYLGGGATKQDCHELNRLAPLYQQAIKWLNDKHQIHVMWTDPEYMDRQIIAACKLLTP